MQIWAGQVSEWSERRAWCGSAGSVRWIDPAGVLAVCLGLFASGPIAYAEGPQRETGLVKLIEEVDVPAREAGLLVTLHVKEGQIVKAGDPLAQLDDEQQRLAVSRAESELRIQSRKATSDVPVRAARKAAAVAQADLDRALAARKNFPESISDSEVDSLRLKAEKAVLDIEQAELELELAQLTRDIRANEVETARLGLARRQITAPLDGVIVEKARQAGEWVQPGEKVLRIVRLDRLRVEAFVRATSERRKLVGAAVTFEPSVSERDAAGQVRERAGAERFTGQVVFVHPEVDPVNGQIRVWAEIVNRDALLFPGDRGLLTFGAAAP
jgi:multidrug efflux pump subunit AcrA (membrane-fusion protein)